MPSSVLFTKVLVANRGEIALRTVRALHDLGIASVAVYADDDAASPHVQAATAAVALGATGPAAYLDGARLIAIAQTAERLVQTATGGSQTREWDKLGPSCLRLLDLDDETLAGLVEPAAELIKRID